MSAVEGWIKTKIRDIFETSFAGDWGSEGTPENGVPVLRSTNFRNNGSIDYSDITYRKVEKQILTKRYVAQGSILIEKSGGSPIQPAGRVVYCDRDLKGTASNFIEVIKVKNNFSPRYVAFLLHHLYQSGLVLKYQQQTTGIINFKLNEYGEEIVNFPESIEEQTKIAEILSCIDTAIEQTEAIIAKQQRIKTGLMQDLLSKGIDEHGNIRSEQTHAFKDSPLGRIPVEWSVLSLGEIANVSSGTTPSRTNMNYWIDGTIAWVKTAEVNFSYIEDTEEKVTQLAIKHGLRIHPKGSVLIAMYGQGKTRGRCAFLSINAAINQACASIIGNHANLHQHYLFCFFQSKYDDLRSIGHGSNQVNLNTGILSNYFVKLPELKEQQKISNIFIQLENDTLLEMNKLKKLQRTKTALMQDLLSGNVWVNPLLSQQ